nr:hypothetical protein [Enterobacter bugandensis]
MSVKHKFIEWFTKNNNGCSPSMEDDRGFVHEKTRHMFEAYQAGVTEGEARCAALAAEVQAVKSAALDEIEVINRGGQAYCVKDGMSVNPIYARGWNDCRAKSLSVGTPATDDFLAEVRAQGVEMAVDVVKQCYDNICAGGLQENREYEESIVQPHLDGIDDELKEIIDQLRKGVQS